ncbi:ribonuclease HII [Novymonas esmeraldas]|uniref:Ribonuclease n=1 Tax=Novymonas esmeraldas TaxID=1808958 RepID=A0AAW0EYW3_9TRYP
MQSTLHDASGLGESVQFIIGVDEAGRGCMAGPVGVAAALYRVSSAAVQYTVMDSKSMKEPTRAATVSAMCAELGDGGGGAFVAATVRDGTCCLARPQQQHPLQALAATLVDVAVILERNILNATLEGMSAVCDAVVRAFNAAAGSRTLTPATCAILIDGNRVPWAFMPDADRERVRLQAAKKAEARKRIGADHPALRGFGCTTVVKGDATLLSVAAASVVAKVVRDTHAVSVMHREFPHYGFDRHKGYCTAAHEAELRAFGPCCFHRLDYAPVQAALRARAVPSPRDEEEGSARRTPRSRRAAPPS